MEKLIRQLNNVDSVTREEPRAYDKLREKYLRAHAGRKKLEILEMERQTWCK